MKKPEKTNNVLREAAVQYQTAQGGSIIDLMRAVREGLSFSFFKSLTSKIPFHIEEWSSFLHISERSMQRYKKQERPFDTLQSEKILQIVMLYKKGVEVFGNEETFNEWLLATNVALGGVSPKSLLDNAFGIELVKDTLGQIEYGVLA